MCDCETIDWGAHDFSSSDERTARKEHRCVECSGVILKGDRYERTFVKWEGEVSTHKTCSGCSAWAAAFHTAQCEACGCSGWLLGEMWTAIMEFQHEEFGWPRREDEDDEEAA